MRTLLGTLTRFVCGLNVLFVIRTCTHSGERLCVLRNPPWERCVCMMLRLISVGELRESLSDRGWFRWCWVDLVDLESLIDLKITHGVEFNTPEYESMMNECESTHACR